MEQLFSFESSGVKCKRERTVTFCCCKKERVRKKGNSYKATSGKEMGNSKSKGKAPPANQVAAAPAKTEPAKPNPKVFLDIQMNGSDKGRIVIEVRTFRSIRIQKFSPPISPLFPAAS
jgi:hypothetical protein